MDQFVILKGPSSRLFKQDGSVAVELVEHYWYLTTDTAEVYVAVRVAGQLVLKKINEVDLSVFDSVISDIEDRLTTLENNKSVQTFAEFSQLPTQGSEDILYVVLDKKKSYVWNNDSYVDVASSEGSSLDVDVINGGSAVTI